MRKVLVVDDEPHIRTVLRGYLQADGFEVVEAADGETAVEIVRRDPPDLVLLDVMLPGIDGLEVLRRLRTVSDAYVILVTARAEEVDKLVGLGVGADDYVTKPFSPREVVARVKTVLRRTRADEPSGAQQANPALRRQPSHPGLVCPDPRCRLPCVRCSPDPGRVANCEHGCLGVRQHRSGARRHRRR